MEQTEEMKEMTETEVPEEENKAVETKQEDEKHHHHHHHHSSRGKHSHHQSRKTSRGSGKLKRSIRRFFYKNQKHLRNGAIVAAALIVCAGFLLMGLELSKAKDQQIPRGEQATLSGNVIRLELPLFSEEVSLISGKASAFASRDLSVPVAQVIEQYKEDGIREDLGLPVSLSYNLRGLPSGCSVLKATAELSESPNFEEYSSYILDQNSESVDVYHLKTGTQYYYRIRLVLSNGAVTTVGGEFKTKEEPRFLSVEGIANVRDIGGWKTTDGNRIRQGMVYRGTELEGAVFPDFLLTEQGKQTMRESFGIRTDMDLRREEENVRGVDALGEDVEHIYYETPMYNGIFSNPESIRRVFSDLADESKYPVYIHCTYGRDRTGTICYLLEALLGLDEESLMREYELTALYYGGVEPVEMDKFIYSMQMYAGDTMQEKTEKYLLSIGVTPEEIASIREILLEK